MPPRFAEIFCIMKRNAVYLVLPVCSTTIQPRGKKVRSAISFAINIDPIKVMYMRARKQLLRSLNFATIRLARRVKKFTDLKAQTTASTEKRQESVLKSK